MRHIHDLGAELLRWQKSLVFIKVKKIYRQFRKLLMKTEIGIEFRHPSPT